MIPSAYLSIPGANQLNICYLLFGTQSFIQYCSDNTNLIGVPQQTYIFEENYNSTDCSSGLENTGAILFTEVYKYQNNVDPTDLVCSSTSITCYEHGTTIISSFCIFGGSNPYTQNTCLHGPNSVSYKYYCAVGGSGSDTGTPAYLNPSFPSSTFRLVDSDQNPAAESISNVDISNAGSVTNIQSSKLTQSQIISNAVHGQYGVGTQMQVIFYGEYVAGYNTVVNSVNNAFTDATNYISDNTGITDITTQLATDYYNWNAQFNNMVSNGGSNTGNILPRKRSVSSGFSMNVYHGLNGQVLISVNYANITLIVFNATLYDQYKNIYNGTELYFNMTLTSTITPSATPSASYASKLSINQSIYVLLCIIGLVGCCST
jgi:hypothetical protein